MATFSNNKTISIAKRFLNSNYTFNAARQTILSTGPGEYIDIYDFIVNFVSGAAGGGQNQIDIFDNETGVSYFSFTGATLSMVSNTSIPVLRMTPNSSIRTLYVPLNNAAISNVKMRGLSFINTP